MKKFIYNLLTIAGLLFTSHKALDTEGINLESLIWIVLFTIVLIIRDHLVKTKKIDALPCGKQQWNHVTRRWDDIKLNGGQ